MNLFNILRKLAIPMMALLVCVIGIAWSFSFTNEVMAGEDRVRKAREKTSPRLEKELRERKHQLRMGNPIYIQIFKESRELEVWVQGRNSRTYRLFKTYPIASWGQGTLGPKLEAGDGQAPEGCYLITKSGMNPLSEFHLSLDLGYPNIYDEANGRTGGDLMIHGSTESEGSYAMTDSAIEEIYTLASAAFQMGQSHIRVHAFPFRMTQPRLQKAAIDRSQWTAFWFNLKEGYDSFKLTEIPPMVLVQDQAYRFEQI